MKKNYKTIQAIVFFLVIASMKLSSQALSGLYTINSGAATGGTNFQTFNAFVTALTTTAGVSGAVTVNVVPNSGPYNEQIIIPQVAGMSANNKLTINGNNNTLAFNSINPGAPWTMCFNGLDFTTVNNLIFDAQNFNYGYATNLTNSSENNNFNNCEFRCPFNATSSFLVPFSISGSNTSATTFGSGGAFNTITSCTMTSGYYCVTNCGNTALPYYGSQNTFEGCKFSDFYVYGFYAPYSKNMTIRNSTFERLTRTLVTTCYVNYCYYSQGMMFENNKIWKIWEAVQGSPSAFYAFYNYGAPIANGLRNTYRNNIITDIKNNGTDYGFYTYNSGSDIYNNTIDFDYAGATSANTCWGFYPYGSVGFVNNMYNNIITMRRGGAGFNRYGFYMGLVGNSNIDRNDVVIVNAGVPGYQNYANGVQSTLAGWQAVGYDMLGFANVDPQYTSLTDLKPTNVAIDNASSYLGLVFDYNGALRNQSTPDIGAIEFLTPACVGSPTVTGISSPTFAICPGGTANNFVINPNINIGVTYQWQYSNISQVGPWTSVPNATSVVYSATNVTATTWVSAIITCTNSGLSNLPVGQINVAGTTTNTVPYLENFESLGINNRLPNCSWASTGLGTSCLTFTAAVANSGGYANSGSGFARFVASATGTNYFYTNGIQLNTGTTYSASTFYLTDATGNVNWTDLSLLVGSAQTPSALTSIVSSNGAVSSSAYNSLSNTFTVATSGLYYIAVRGTSNGTGSPYISIDDIRVIAPCNINSPTVSVAGSSVICAGSSATLTASGATSYLWSNGSTNASIVVNPSTSNMYSVIGTNASGCSSNVSSLVTVNSLPSIAIFANPGTAICNGSSLNLSAIGSASSYTWSTNSNNTSIVVTPTATSTYTLSGSGNGCTGLASVLITVNPKPVVAAISLGSGNNVCVGEVTGLAGNGALTYQWSSPSIFLQGNTVNVSPNVTTIYTVTGTDGNGCTGTGTLQLNVSACTGISNINAKESGILVYPNPNTGEFTVEINNALNKLISVVDLTGRVLFTSNTNDAKINLNITKFTAGIYYVKVQTANTTEVIKVVKQ